MVMKINNLLMIASALVLLVSCWNRNALPGDIDLLPSLDDAPRQSTTSHSPFDLQFDGSDYRIEPEYDYELHGLVVSFRHHDGNSRMHVLADDHLNMLDVCVVWGTNASNGYLHAFDFWNGIFTCNFKTRDQAAWDAFDLTAVSNNHLLSDDPLIRRQVQKLRVGDQIRVRGKLASYVSGNGSRRGTSTTRDDTGNGACETIYVESFQNLRPATSGWRLAMWTSLFVLLATLVAHFARPFKSRV